MNELINEQREQIAQLAAERDNAWRELLEIREAINASQEESTSDEVRRVTAERDALAAQNEFLIGVLQSIGQSHLEDGEAEAAESVLCHTRVTKVECLRQVRADAVGEFMNKAMHEIANSYTSSTPVTPWESGMNSMIAMFAKYTQKYLKILRNNESTSILAGKE